MAANSSIILSNLDFEAQKNTLKQYLRSQDRFKDYDFEGSNMNVLLDILSYNTYMNAFYLNMVGSEMFLDTAQLRDSVVSHAKELNYTPSSFRSAEATIAITINTADANKRSITIPKGTTFSSRVGTSAFTFSTGENIVVSDRTVEGSNYIFTGSNITIYEGVYVTDTFTSTNSNPTRYILTNNNVDISSINVIVIEDMGATTLTYKRANSLFGLNSQSQVFFIQGAPGGRYEIVFGDDVTGRKPKDNSIINIEYRICNGELPNGCSVFRADTAIDQETNIAVFTDTPAAGGTIAESVESIKFNAPRHFATQERAVTTDDYETLMKLNFPEVNVVTAYGGEEVDPPQFGKVFVAVDLKDLDGLPDVKRDQYYRFLKPRSPVSIDPVIISPDYMYVYVESLIKYNVNVTSLNPDDVRTLAISSILNFALTNLNDFNKTMRYSRLTQAIDATHPSIVSNETICKAVKYITPVTGIAQTLNIDFGVPLEVLTPDIDVNVTTDKHAVETTTFIYKGKKAFLQDDGNGIMRVVATPSGTQTVIVPDAGTVNYETGLVQLSNFEVDSYTGGQIKVYAATRSKDILSTKNTILNINESDIQITVQQVRE